MTITSRDLQFITDIRVNDPSQFTRALQERRKRSVLTRDGRLFLLAADHPARGALSANGNERAMADRHDLLQRVAEGLEVPGVDGILASADIIEDLTVLGLLNDRVVIGTTNRGGIVGADWELDDRMTAYDADHIMRLGLDGGKMLLRIAQDDANTARTLEACAKLVTELADRALMAMIEPLPYARNPEGGVRLIRDEAQLLSAVTIASGLGSSSAYSWLKVPAWSNVEVIAAASTLPMLILGGAAGPDLESSMDIWSSALAHPTVRGLVIGRALLYPQTGDVGTAVAAAAKLVRP
jgi:DhnA family fructose-bisphosphate aldolase class Ia